MIRRLSIEQLTELSSKDISHISPWDKDEMAIPSYLHKNFLIRWLMWKRYECISILAKFSKDMTVLEFGCGIGVFLPELNISCGKVYAIDHFPEYAELLNTKFDLNINFIKDISEISENSLDIIVAADVLEHIQESDLNEYLGLFLDKLKCGHGRLIMSGPTENIAYKIGRGLAGFGDKGDYHLTNVDRLIKKIERAGFHLVNLQTLPFAFPPYLFKVCEFKNA